MDSNIIFRYRDADGLDVIRNQTAPKAGYTVTTLPGPWPVGPGLDRYDAATHTLGRYVSPAAALTALSTTLNLSLTALFKTAPIWLQVAYSNITAPIATMISAGQLTTAIAALQGIIDNQQVPTANFPLIETAIALITAQEPAFAALQPAPAPAPAPAA